MGIDHELRFLETTQAARDIIAAGGIGDVWHVAVNVFSDFGGFGKIHSWWHEREKGGGLSNAIGTHMIDLCAFLTGQRIVKLCGLTSIFIKERPVQEGSDEMKTATSDDAFTLTGTLSGGGS